MGATVVDLKGIRALCPGGEHPRSWHLEKEQAGLVESIAVYAPDMAQLVADSVDAAIFAESAAIILGDWYVLAADIEPSAEPFKARHRRFASRLRSLCRDFRSL